ncbi:MAG: arginase family protein [Alphaproteobacteria bacterium]|nr:arginase family protein [Alphaproteobacteria bacterium]
MSSSRKVPPFLGTRFAKTARAAQAAVFAARYGTPYRGIDNKVHAAAGDAFRRALAADAEWLEHWDFDFGGPLLPKPDFKAVDLGNLATSPRDGKGNRRKIEAMTRAILKEGAVPIMFGGDDSVPIPFIEAFSGGPPVMILQIDAHIDWRDERYGERMGFSSTMRRASECAHVWRMVQVGARGMGSAREGEIRTAQDWGSHLFTSRDVLRHGVAPVLEHVEEGSACVINLDLDVLDSSVMPAVAYPSPGGLGFHHVVDLIAGVAAKAKIAGFAMVEFEPRRDPAGTAAFTAARIAAHVLGHLCRAQ